MTADETALLSLAKAMAWSLVSILMPVDSCLGRGVDCGVGAGARRTVTTGSEGIETGTGF